MAILIGSPGVDDTLVGVKNEPNTIYGDSDGTLMGMQALAGNDMLTGGANSDNTIYGDALTLTATNGGNDILIGGKGGSNTLIGDAANAVGGPIIGGDDRLVSADRATDNMWGDFQNASGPGMITGGHDTFVFTVHNGSDVIHDFQQGVDTIEIDTKPSQPLTFANLNIQVAGTDSIIHFDAHDSITVLGVTALSAADFHFVTV